MEKVFEKTQIPFDVGLFVEEFIESLKTKKTPKELTVKKISNNYANEYVLKHHYLQRKVYVAKNVSYGLFADENCVGVCMFGYPVWKEYPGLVPPMEGAEVPELLRLCTIANLPKNSESYFVSRCLKMMKKDWFEETGKKPKAITSLCDLAFGFNGSIYKATNFELLRITKGRPTNPGKSHGKWKKNEHNQEAKKAMYVKWL